MRKLKRVAFAFLLICSGTFLVWRLVLSLEINSALARIRAAGLPVVHEELNAWHAEVPDQENAAIRLEDAFALLKDLPDSRSNEVRRLKIPGRGSSMDAEQKRMLIDYVALNLDAVSKAEDGSKLSQCRYFIDYRLGINTPLPHLSKLKQLAQLLQYQTYVSAESGDLETASRAVVTTLALAGTLDSEPIMISQLTRCSMIRLAVSGFEARANFGDLSFGELAKLASALSTAGGRTNLMARALIGERALCVPYFRMSTAEAQRIASTDEDGVETPPQPMIPGRRPLLMSVTGFMDRDLRFYLKTLETNIPVASLSPPDNLVFEENLEKAGDVARRKFLMLSMLNLPSMSRAVTREVSATACLRLASASIAVERFRIANRRLPASLSEISAGDFPLPPIDPFDGRPLRYRQLPKGYVIYSVDADRHDDNGRERPERKKSTDKSSYDLTFTVER